MNAKTLREIKALIDERNKEIKDLRENKAIKEDILYRLNDKILRVEDERNKLNIDFNIKAIAVVKLARAENIE